MLPNLIIIGAQKCGTTSLHHYLSMHPQVFMSQQKELNFFNEDIAWANGQPWYESQFQGDYKIHGESSPNYTRFPWKKGVAEKMHALIPQAKLIYVVRDPVERMISHYTDRYIGGRETRNIDEALRDFKDPLYICVSKYHSQIALFFKYYPLFQVLILDADDLKNKRKEALKRVFQFLEVDDSFSSKEFDDLKNVSERKVILKKPRKWARSLFNYDQNTNKFTGLFAPVTPSFLKEKYLQSLRQSNTVERPALSNETRSLVIDELRDDIKRFRELSGQAFESWAV